MTVNRVSVKEDDVMVFVFPNDTEETMVDRRKQIMGNFKRAGMANQKFLAMSGDVRIAVLEGACRAPAAEEHGE